MVRDHLRRKMKKKNFHQLEKFQLLENFQLFNFQFLFLRLGALLGPDYAGMLIFSTSFSRLTLKRDYANVGKRHLYR